MPNWCDNTVTLIHADKIKLDALENELKKPEPEFFQSLRPYEGEWDYGWCCENWGCKWEARVYDHERIDDNIIRITFETAWAPPITLYEYLESQDWNVVGYYYEPGVCFAGIYSEGCNDEYDYSEMSADEIEEELPEELNEMYNIAGYQRDWEEENQDEEDDEEEGEYSQEDIEQALAELKAEFEKLEAEEEENKQQVEKDLAELREKYEYKTEPTAEWPFPQSKKDE